MCALAAILLAAMPAAGQSWTPPLTPWGDPDLQGWFSNLNEDGTPLERPEQFAGRSLDDIKPAELAAIRRGIQQRTLSNFEGPLHAPDHWKKLFVGSSGTGAPDERPEK
jgi:hypothetical protein